MPKMRNPFRGPVRKLLSSEKKNVELSYTGQTDKLVRKPTFAILEGSKNPQKHEAIDTHSTMRITWFVSLIGLSSAGAFVPLWCPHTRSDHGKLFVMESQGREMSRRGIVHFFGIGAWWLAIQQDSWAAESSAPSEAVGSPSDPFGSSSVQVSDAIKTLDMSMPSYGEIKAPTASVENVDGLTVPYNPRGGQGQPQGSSGKSKKNPNRKPLVLQFPGAGSGAAEKEKSSMSYNF
jgi:hypothetical protein